MRPLLPVFLFSFCALNASINTIDNREDLREIFQAVQTGSFDYAMEKIHDGINYIPNPNIKDLLFLERAFLHLAMQSPHKALEDLNTIVWGIFSFPQEDTAVKALWMRLAISARLQNSNGVVKAFDLLKKWDRGLPQVTIHHNSVTIISRTNSSLDFITFTELLEGLGLRGAGDQKVMSVNAGYFEAQINERADPFLVELAAACAFTDSPWGSAALEYVGKTFAPQVHWKTTNLTKHADGTYRELLRNLKNYELNSALK
jgi:hypothetical protein